MTSLELTGFGHTADQTANEGSTDSRIDRVLEAIRKHLGMEVAYLSEFVDDRSVFRAIDAPGFEEFVQVGSSLALEDLYCKHICEGRLPELIPDTAANSFAAAMPITSEIPIGSHMSLPIKRPDGSLYGMFCCLSSKPNATLNPRDLGTMSVFADLATEYVHEELLADQEVQHKRERVLQALERGQFRTVFQPIWDIGNRQPIGFESLCRFEAEPYRSPDLWFNEAAETGLGVELELAVISKALEALSSLGEDLYLSINVSPSTIMSGQMDEVFEGMPLHRLVLEITEHAIVTDYQKLDSALMSLRQRGLRIAVDDAGAGYSSLQHIVRLRPDIIKLDMSLTRGIDTDQALRSLANALIHFSRETGALMVAEGIETEGEYQMLKRLGVYGGQGYHLGRPDNLEAALELTPDSPKMKASAA